MKKLFILRIPYKAISICFILALLNTTIIAQTNPEILLVKFDDDLEVREILPGAFVVTHAFPWGGNSLIVLIGDKDAVFVDTPYTPEATDKVLDWIVKEHGERSFIEINTGYHVDNLGGNEALVRRNIPIVGSDKTVELLRQRGEAVRQLTMGWLEEPEKKDYRERHATIPYIEPNIVFPLSDGYRLTVGNERIEVIFPGETHSPDNVVVYFPERKLLFGGCMLRAGKGTGNLRDANMDTWKTAVMKLLELECDAIVPGHGVRFDPGVIENTISVLP